MSQVKSITGINDLTNEKRVIISGDFNSDHTEHCIKMWIDPNQTDMLDTINAIVQQPGVGYGTFHAFAGKTNGVRMDYVLVSNDFQLVNYEIIHKTKNGRYPSDHFPIIAEFQLI